MDLGIKQLMDLRDKRIEGILNFDVQKHPCCTSLKNFETGAFNPQIFYWKRRQEKKCCKAEYVQRCVFFVNVPVVKLWIAITS